MKLTACIQTYNRVELLDRCIRSAKKYCNRIIVVDGAFADYPHKNPMSTDSTIKLASDSGAELILTNKAWTSEAAKRNAYLDLLKPNEWFIYLDDDEQICSLDLNKINYDMALVDLSIGKELYQAPRIIKYKLGLVYVTHYIVSYQSTHYDLGFDKRNKGVSVGTIKTEPPSTTQEYSEWKKIQGKKEGLEKGKVISTTGLKAFHQY